MSIIINQDYIESLKQYWIKVEFDCQLWECKNDLEFKHRQQLLYEINDIKELASFKLLSSNIQHNYISKKCALWYQKRISPHIVLQQLMDLFTVKEFSNGNITQAIINGKMNFSEVQKEYLTDYFNVPLNTFDTFNYVRDEYGDSLGYYWYNPIVEINHYLENISNDVKDHLSETINDFDGKMKNLEIFTKNDLNQLQIILNIPVPPEIKYVEGF